MKAFFMRLIRMLGPQPESSADVASSEFERAAAAERMHFNGM